MRRSLLFVLVLLFSLTTCSIGCGDASSSVNAKKTLVSPKPTATDVFEASLSSSSTSTGFPIEEQEQLMAIFEVTAKQSCWLKKLGLSVNGTGTGHMTDKNTFRVTVDGKNYTASFEINGVSEIKTDVKIDVNKTRIVKVYLDTIANAGYWKNDETLSVHLIEAESEFYRQEFKPAVKGNLARK